MAFSATAQTDSVALINKHILVAFLIYSGKWQRALLDLDDCIGNIDGALVWGARNYSSTSMSAYLVKYDYCSRPTQFYLNATLKKDDASETEAFIDLNQGIANVNGEFKYQPISQIRSSSPRAPEPIDVNTNPSSSKTQHTHPSSEQTNTFELSSSQAKGTITTLPPHNPPCTAFAAMFTEPNGRQLCFTACPILAFPTFSAEVALSYGEICEAAGVRSFGGSVSKSKTSLYLDNGVRIVGDVVSGGPEREVAIAGSDHWAVSRRGDARVNTFSLKYF